jgi:hypothetical protein
MTRIQEQALVKLLKHWHETGHRRIEFNEVQGVNPRTVKAALASPKCIKVLAKHKLCIQYFCSYYHHKEGPYDRFFGHVPACVTIDKLN